MKQVNLSTFSRSDLSNIPVFVPPQRYNVYSRHWSSSIPPVDEDMSDPLLTHTTNQSKRQNTWNCLILSIIFTALFYAIFFDILAVIAWMVVRLFQKGKEKFELNVMNRTQGTGIGN